MCDLSIIIPTLNGEGELKSLLPKIKKSVKDFKYEIIVIDSDSTDNTVESARLFGAKVIAINKNNFNHGGTRNLAAREAVGKFLLFLTQDALLYDEQSIKSLFLAFENDLVAVAYGKQVPYPQSGEIGSFARLHNYPETSVIKGLHNKKEFGIKTVFNSNSFSMYKKEIFFQLGCFPENVILGEDMYFAAKAVLNNFKIAYVSNARVYHSHDYSIWKEFQRNFDIGVFHKKEKWILDTFSKPEGEGLKFVKSEIKYLFKKNKIFLIPYAFIKNVSKYLGYKLGNHFDKLPYFLIKKFSMYNAYWIKNQDFR